MADIVRAKGRQYPEHYQSSVSYWQQLAHIGLWSAGLYRCRFGGHKDYVSTASTLPHS